MPLLVSATCALLIHCNNFLTQAQLKAFPHTIYELIPNYPLVLFCALVIVVQFIFLYAQRKYGPRRVFPRCLLSPSYDYEFTINSDASSSELKEDCAICLVPLSGKSSLKLDYYAPQVMQAPCRHRFHGSCLVYWMSNKLSCPVCIRDIPEFT